MLHPTNDDTENVALDFGEEEEFSKQRLVRHPIAVFFHLLFRVSALLAYLLCQYFSSSFIVNFVVIILLLSMDFWAVKNITGRLLVGLRWWNYVDEDGLSHWVYEAKKGAAKNLITNTESRIFWVSLIVCQILWVVFLFGNLFFFHLKWFMVVCVANILNGANLYGYIRCKMGSGKKMTSMASSFFGQQMFSTMLSNLTSGKKSSGTNQS